MGSLVRQALLEELLVGSTSSKLLGDVQAGTSGDVPRTLGDSLGSTSVKEMDPLQLKPAWHIHEGNQLAHFQDSDEPVVPHWLQALDRRTNHESKWSMSNEAKQKCQLFQAERLDSLRADVFRCTVDERNSVYRAESSSVQRPILVQQDTLKQLSNLFVDTRLDGVHREAMGNLYCKLAGI